MGAKPRKYAETSFFLVCVFPTIFFPVLLILWLNHQVPVKSEIKRYKYKAAVYSFEDSVATLMWTNIILTTKHLTGFRAQKINSSKHKHYEDLILALSLLFNCSDLE